jgi:hypothetical protein
MATKAVDAPQEGVQTSETDRVPVLARDYFVKIEFVFFWSIG